MNMSLRCGFMWAPRCAACCCVKSTRRLLKRRENSGWNAECGAVVNTGRPHMLRLSTVSIQRSEAARSAAEVSAPAATATAEGAAMCGSSCANMRTT